MQIPKVQIPVDKSVESQDEDQNKTNKIPFSFIV